MPITNSHFVTKSLLKRFTYNKKILVHNKLYSNISYKDPEQISYIQFPSAVINKHETMWSQIEARMTNIFRLVDNGQVLESEEHKKIIKEFIALHFVRSMHVLALIGRDEKKYYNQIFENVIRENPDKEEEIKNLIPAQRKIWIYKLRTEFLTNFFENNLERVQKFVRDQDIEIGEVFGNFELILSDSPIINLGDENKHSILEGASLEKSTTFIMPLGPRHLVGLKSKNASKEYIHVLTNSVERINSFSFKQSISYFYSNPATSKYPIGYE